MQLQKKSWSTTVEVQGACKSPHLSGSGAARKAHGRDAWETHMKLASSTEMRQKVPERSQMGADVCANPVTRNLAWWEAGRISAPCPGKAGSLLPQRSGWGKDPLLPVSSSPTALLSHRTERSQGTGTARNKQQHQEKLQSFVNAL